VQPVLRENIPESRKYNQKKNFQKLGDGTARPNPRNKTQNSGDNGRYHDANHSRAHKSFSHMRCATQEYGNSELIKIPLDFLPVSFQLLIWSEDKGGVATFPGKLRPFIVAI